MATRRKRNLNFLPAETRPEPVIDISAYPVDIGVGELMRLTRERLGHELQTVANQLRIRLSYLEAIEDARFRDLPGTTYAVGFVRSYADYLGLDGADIVRRFREEAARIHGQTKLVFPALTAEGKLPRAAVLLVSALGLAGVYGVWYYISSHQKSDLPVITDVPERLAVVPPDSSPENAAPPQLVEPSAPVEPPATAGEPPATTAPQMPATPVDSGTGTASAATPPQPPVQTPASSGSGAGPSTSPPAAPAVTAPVEAAPAAGAGGPASAAATTASASAGATGAQHVAGQTSQAQAQAAPPAAGTGSAPIAPATTATGAQAAAGETSQAPAVPPVAATSGSATEPTRPAAAANDIPAAPSTPAATGKDASQQMAAVPPASPAGTQPAAETPPGVVLEAHMDSWIKVVDAKGKTVTQQVLKAGDRYVVPDQPGLILRTGNAGGLDVLVGGRKAPPLGDVGTVLTKVTLEPSRLLDGTAVAD